MRNTYMQGKGELAWDTWPIRFVLKLSLQSENETNDLLKSGPALAGPAGLATPPLTSDIITGGSAEDQSPAYAGSSFMSEEENGGVIDGRYSIGPEDVEILCHPHSPLPPSSVTHTPPFPHPLSHSPPFLSPSHSYLHRLVGVGSEDHVTIFSSRSWSSLATSSTPASSSFS